MSTYPMIQKRLPSSTLQLPQYRRFQAALRRRFEARLATATDGASNGAVVADGKWHSLKGGGKYCLNLDAPNPVGEFFPDTLASDFKVYPTYRDCQGNIDSELLVLARDDCYKVENKKVGNRYFHCDKPLIGVVAASVETIEVTEMRQFIYKNEPSITAIRLGVRLQDGCVANIELEISDNKMPPSCGNLQPGGRVVLRCKRVDAHRSRLLEIMEPSAIVEVRKKNS